MASIRRRGFFKALAGIAAAPTAIKAARAAKPKASERAIECRQAAIFSGNAGLRCEVLMQKADGTSEWTPLPGVRDVSMGGSP